ncbi:MAG: hypothetical protein CMH76_03535, partial [Nitrospinae bacterium]|nr:hypothetical protein [Nitrospinota bacterium]
SGGAGTQAGIAVIFCQRFGLGYGSQHGKQGGREKAAPNRKEASHIQKGEEFTDHAEPGLQLHRKFRI